MHYGVERSTTEVGIMAKGQQRSNRETKKPKKQAAEKANKELSPYKQSLQQQGAPGMPTKKP